MQLTDGRRYGTDKNGGAGHEDGRSGTDGGKTEMVYGRDERTIGKGRVRRERPDRQVGLGLHGNSIIPFALQV